MAENLFCQESHCGLPAQAFGFVNGEKRKVCEAHISTLIQKKATLYSIDAFTFIKTPEDGPTYYQRHSLMQQGLGVITWLESACEKDWEEGQKQLQEICNVAHETVQRSFQEMWVRGRKCYEEMKETLSDTRNRLEKLVLDQDFRLTAEETTLCGSAPVGRLFRVMAGDCRLHIAEALIANFHIVIWKLKAEKQTDWAHRLQELANSQAEAGWADLAMETAKCAKEFGALTSDFELAASQQSQIIDQRLNSLFEKSTLGEAEECLQKGKISSKSGDFDAAIEELQRGKKLLIGPNCLEVHLQLSVNLAETYCQAGRWQDAVSECERILTTWTDDRVNPYYFEALYYFMFVNRYLNQLSQTVVAKWSAKLTVASPRCEWVFLCIQAFIYEYNQQFVKAEESYKAVLQLDHMSYITICSRVHFALMYKGQGKLQQAEQLSISAKELLSAYFPFSFLFAIVLNTLGLLYCNLNRPKEAEKLHLKAAQIFLHCSPLSINYAINQFNVGLVYDDMGEVEKAIEGYQSAIQLFIARFPEDAIHARCRNNLGLLYHNKNQLKSAEEQYLIAIAIHQASAPLDEEHARTLFNLGTLYIQTSRPKDAEHLLQASIALSSTYYPGSHDYAKALLTLGSLCQKQRVWDRAEEHLLKSMEVFGRFYPKSPEYLNCCSCLVQLYRDTGRGSEAAEMMEVAQRIGK